MSMEGVSAGRPAVAPVMAMGTKQAMQKSRAGAAA